MKSVTGTGVALIFVLAGAIVWMFVQNSRQPGNLGVHDGRLSPLPSTPNGVSSQAENPAKQVAPLSFQGSLEESRQRLLLVLREYGNMEIVEASTDYIHAINTTRIMRFKDDLEFYLDAESRLIQVRTRSRVGYSDLGLNRKRYEQLKKMYLE